MSNEFASNRRRWLEVAIGVIVGVVALAIALSENLRHAVSKWFNQSSAAEFLVWAMVGFVALCVVATCVLGTWFAVARYRIRTRAVVGVGTVISCADAGDGEYHLRVALESRGEHHEAFVLTPVYEPLQTGEQVPIFYDPTRPHLADLRDRFGSPTSRIKFYGPLVVAWLTVLWAVVLIAGEVIWG